MHPCPVRVRFGSDSGRFGGGLVRFQRFGFGVSLSWAGTVWLFGMFGSVRPVHVGGRIAVRFGDQGPNPV